MCVCVFVCVCVCVRACIAKSIQCAFFVAICVLPFADGLRKVGITDTTLALQTGGIGVAMLGGYFLARKSMVRF